MMNVRYESKINNSYLTSFLCHFIENKLLLQKKRNEKSSKNSYIIETSVVNYTGKEQARKRSKINTYDRRLGYARTASATPFMKHRGLEEEEEVVVAIVAVVVVVSDCILTSTSFVLTPRNIISPIAHRHQVAISWSRHVQRRTKRFDFADSDQSNFVRGSPSSVFPPVSRPPDCFSFAFSALSNVAKISPFPFFSLFPHPSSIYFNKWER